VLVDARMDEIRETTGSGVADAIRSFRDGEIKIVPGGGGAYGRLEIAHKDRRGQRSLTDF